MNPIIVAIALLLFINTSWAVAAVLMLGIIVAFLVSLIVRQETMLYVPCVLPGMQTPEQNPEGMRSPAEHDLPFEDVWLQTDDDVKVHAWFITTDVNPEEAPTILFCHANAGNIGLRVPNFAQLVARLEVNILAFDYRGYGLSEGSPTEEGLIEDVLSAWRWLQDAGRDGRVDARKVFIFGRSLGGAVAIALAHELQQRNGEEGMPCGIILENTFTSISGVVDALFPVVAFTALKERFLRLKWESIQRIQDVEAPFLFITGEKDELIPPWHSEALCSKALQSPYRRQAAFPEGMHNDTWEKGGEEYWEWQAQFVDDCLAAVDGKDYPSASPLRLRATGSTGSCSSKCEENSDDSRKQS
eukprot:TRINITY_DN72569_c0_g1_i1.p1 TRINITY_DN72569_c0_g1~~TRINITY_DN72569_c0_g1_i1.p1  ORF type:complete len:358 (+),score=78.30 TRINITY_DN72569_c0_g1_i1:101-1174(+)